MLGSLTYGYTINVLTHTLGIRTTTYVDGVLGVVLCCLA